MSKRILVACSVLAVAGIVSAAPVASSDVTVTGTISPSSCALVLTGNSVDFGRMTTSEVQKFPVSEDAWYGPPNKFVNLVASCASPTKFALSVIDNRAGSALGPVNFGLGTYTRPGGAAQSIGNYWLIYDGATSVRATSDSQPAAPAHYFETEGEPSAASVWTPTGHAFTVGKFAGFAAAVGSTSPDALVEVSMTLTLGTAFSKAVVDGATTDMVLDGSTTITMSIF